ncbi:glycosyltransferase [Patescibacteria group bacterium]|nr:glycosyltransferase [Patescibacteria group bacterium]
MKNNAMISVIVPVFNGEKFIGECLKSILSQDYENFELIVVDNNSNDKTSKIVQDLATQYQKIIYIFESRRSRGAARNAGVLAARGDLIAMTDADCLVPKDWLKLMSQPIFQGLSSVVMGFQREAITNYWSKMRQIEDENFLKKNQNNNFIDHLDTKNFIIKTEIIKQILFNSNFKNFEDWDFFIKLKKAGLKVYFLPDIQVLHFHDSSAKELFRTQISRAYFASAIIDFHKKDEWFVETFRENIIVLSLRLRTFLLFIPWSVWQLITRPKKSFYIILADFSWKLGATFYFLSKNRQRR